MKALHKAANEMEEKAEDLRQLTLLTQPYSLWKTAGTKEKAHADLIQQLKEKLLSADKICTDAVFDDTNCWSVVQNV